MTIEDVKKQFATAMQLAKPGAERLHVTLDPRLVGIQLTDGRLTCWTATCTVTLAGDKVTLGRRKS